MKFYLVECTCKEGEKYCDGSEPSFYADEKKAAYMYSRLKGRKLYWGVHLNGLHIMKVEP